MSACPFCDRIDNHDYDQSYAGGLVVRFPPLNPVTEGHMLFVPGWHAEHPSAEAIRATMSYAETYAAKQGVDFNLITSSGPAATQTIPHVHVHYVPRRPDDGLPLPWTGQKERPATARYRKVEGGSLLLGHPGWRAPASGGYTPTSGPADPPATPPTNKASRR